MIKTLNIFFKYVSQAKFAFDFWILLKQKDCFLKIIYLNLNTSPFNFQRKFIFLEPCIIAFEKEKFFYTVLQMKIQIDILKEN